MLHCLVLEIKVMIERLACAYNLTKMQIGKDCGTYLLLLAFGFIIKPNDKA